MTVFEGTGEATAIDPLEREIVKVVADSILAVDVFLGDVEVLDVRETLLVNCGDEGTGKLLLVICGGVEVEVGDAGNHGVQTSSFVPENGDHKKLRRTFPVAPSDRAFFKRANWSSSADLSQVQGPSLV